MPAIFDGVLNFSDVRFPAGGKGVARLRVYDTVARGRVALVTEMFGNPGPSITNAAETVYSSIVARVPGVQMIIEHYARTPKDEEQETFDILTLSSSGQPEWKPLSEAETMSLLGEMPAPHTKADEPAWLGLAKEPAPRDPRDVALDAASKIAGASALQAWLTEIAPQAAPTGNDDVSYLGVYDPLGQPQIVVIENGGASLLPHFVRHSPDGFLWSYNGSGPADSARCVLAHALGLAPLESDPERIPEVDPVYQDFKSQIIAALPRFTPWAIYRKDVVKWYAAHPRKPFVCPVCREIMDASETSCWNCALVAGN